MTQADELIARLSERDDDIVLELNGIKYPRSTFAGFPDFVIQAAIEVPAIRFFREFVSLDGTRWTEEMVMK